MSLFTLLNNAAANGPGIALNCANTKKASLVVFGTFSGAVVFEASDDNVEWYPTDADKAGLDNCTSTMTPGLFRFDVEPFAYLRPNVATYNSGSITVLGYTDDSKITDVVVVGGTITGSAISGTATGGSTTSLTDASKYFTSLSSATVYITHGGVEYGPIPITAVSGAANQIIDFASIGITFAPGDTYTIVPSTATALAGSIAVEAGTATGGSGTTLTDTSKDWGTNLWAGAILTLFRAGVEYAAVSIVSNSYQQLVFPAPTGAPTITPGDTYKIAASGGSSGGGGGEITGCTIQVPTDIQGVLDIVIANLINVATTAAANIMGTTYQQTASYSGGYNSELSFCASVTGVLSVMIDGVAWQMNGGSPLTTNAGYSFDIPIVIGSTYNLQYSAATATVQAKWIAGVI